jgi:hypothetical protein
MQHKRYAVLICFFVGFLSAQPRMMLALGGGFYEPQLPGFDSNTQFPKTGFFSRNLLLGYSFSYQFFYNARVGLTSLNSLQSGKIENGAAFSRRLVYRLLTVETFFIFKRRMEFNFTLAPMWNKGTISLNTQSSNDDWNALLSSYGNQDVALKSDDIMRARWFGFASLIGFRFYIFSWLAADVKAGFMNNYYKPEQWKFQGKSIQGPELKIDKLPLFTAGIVVGW